MFAVTTMAVGAVTLIASPAQAAWGPLDYSNCIRTSTSATLNTYATAQSRVDMYSNSPTQVRLYTYGYGRTYDCGFHGHPISAPTIRVQVRYVVTGVSLHCSAGTDGNVVTLNCSSDKSYVESVFEYSCQNVSTCTVSATPVTFEANNGGTVTRITMKTTVFINGPYESTSADSPMVAFQR
jgi:hypothetical protein